MTIDDYYANVPAEQRDALRAFRETYTPHKTVSNDTEWTYYAGGSGTRTILWLVGGLKRADAAYRSIPLLADNFRIIAPDYPAVSSMAGYADGLTQILNAEDVKSAYVLAGSFGGMVAQVFLRAYPERVAKVVLSTTTAPDTSQIERYQQLMQLAQSAPEDLLVETAQSQMLLTIAPPEKEIDFYRAYLKELYEERLDRADIVSIYAALIDYMGMTFSPADLDDWSGEMLIISSDDDRIFDDTAQERLTALYPDARTHVFSGAGHSPGSTRRESYFSRVRSFFVG